MCTCTLAVKMQRECRNDAAKYVEKMQTGCRGKTAKEDADRVKSGMQKKTRCTKDGERMYKEDTMKYKAYEEKTQRSKGDTKRMR